MTRSDLKLPIGLAGRTSSISRERIFFALKPEPTVANEIAVRAARLFRQQDVNVAPIEPKRLHVSVLFVGESLPDPLVSLVRQAAKGVVGEHCSLAFDRVARFGGGAIVLYGGDGVAAVLKLRMQLQRALGAHRAARLQRFTPHMTIGYSDHSRSELAIAPLRWSATRLYLIRSRTGCGHDAIASWPIERATE